MSGKLSEPHFDVWLYSNLVMIFSSQVETNDTLQPSSVSFPPMVTYILCMENCQNNILMHSCLPMERRLFYNVKKFHGTRISEYNPCNCANRNKMIGEQCRCLPRFMGDWKQIQTALSDPRHAFLLHCTLICSVQLILPVAQGVPQSLPYTH